MEKEETIKKLLGSVDFNDVKIGISLLDTVSWEELQKWFGPCSNINSPKIPSKIGYQGYRVYYRVNSEYLVLFSDDCIVFRNPKVGFYRDDYEIKEL